MATFIRPFEIAPYRIYSVAGGVLSGFSPSSTAKLFADGYTLQVGDKICFHQNEWVRGPQIGIELPSFVPPVLPGGASFSGVWRYVSVGGTSDFDPAGTGSSDFNVVSDGTSGLTQAGSVVFEPPTNMSNYFVQALGGGYYLYAYYFEITAVTGTPTISSGFSIPANSSTEQISSARVYASVGEVVGIDDFVAFAPDLFIKKSDGNYDCKASLIHTGDGEFSDPGNVLNFLGGARPIIKAKASYGDIEDVSKRTTMHLNSNAETSYEETYTNFGGSNINRMTLDFQSSQGGWDLPFTYDDTTILDLQIVNSRSSTQNSGSVLSNIGFIGRGHVEDVSNTITNVTKSIKHSETDKGLIALARVLWAGSFQQDNGSGGHLDVCLWNLSTTSGLLDFFEPTAKGLGGYAGNFICVDSTFEYKHPHTNASVTPFFNSPSASTLSGLTAYLANSVKSVISHQMTGAIGDTPVTAQADGIISEAVLTTDTVQADGFTTSSEQLGFGFRKIVQESTGDEYYLTKASGVGGVFVVDRDWDTTPIASDRFLVLPVIKTESYEFTGNISVWDKTVLAETEYKYYSIGKVPIRGAYLLTEKYVLPYSFSDDSLWQSGLVDYTTALAYSGILVDTGTIPATVTVTRSGTPVDQRDLYDYLRAYDATNQTSIVTSGSLLGIELDCDLELQGDIGVALTGDIPMVITGDLLQNGTNTIYTIADFPITDTTGTSSILKVLNPLSAAIHVQIHSVSVADETGAILSEIVNAPHTEAEIPYMLSAAQSGTYLRLHVTRANYIDVIEYGTAAGQVIEVSAPETLGLSMQNVRDSMALDLTGGTTVETNSIDDKIDSGTATAQEIWEYADRKVTGYTNPNNRKSVNDKLDDFLGEPE